MTEWVEQWICIKFGIKLKHSSAETIWMIQEAAATGDWQFHHDNVPSHVSLSCAECFGETSNHPSDSVPYSSDLALCDFWLFSKLKSPLKEKRFQTIDEIQENMMGQLMAIRIVWGPRCLLWRGLKHHCPSTMFLVSCIFFNKHLYFSYYMAGYLLDRTCISWCPCLFRCFGQILWIRNSNAMIPKIF